MFKPNSLREHLSAAVPDFRRDPDKLRISANAGRIVCTAAGGLSFEYRYTLSIVVLDYAHHADAVIVPLLAWLRIHQGEIFENTALQDKSIRFDADYLNKDTVDLEIEVDLTERVIVKRAARQPPEGSAPGGDPGGLPPGGTDPSDIRFEVQHVQEPPHPGAILQRERWSFYLRDQLLADWDYDPR